MKIKIITKDQARFLITADLQTVTVYGVLSVVSTEEFEPIYSVDDIDEYEILLLVEND